MIITREETRFLSSVFNLIEQINSQELRNTSKHLIRNYIEEAGELGPAECARSAVERYTNTELPSLESIRGKAAGGNLSSLDHLVLKMEWAAKKLEELKRDL